MKMDRISTNHMIVCHGPDKIIITRDRNSTSIPAYSARRVAPSEACNNGYLVGSI